VTVRIRAKMGEHVISVSMFIGRIHFVISNLKGSINLRRQLF
jgi:hypothetical protein